MIVSEDDLRDGVEDDNRRKSLPEELLDNLRGITVGSEFSGLSFSPPHPSDESADSMAEEYNNNINNYKVPQDNIQFTTDGYLSKDRLCPFYFNRGFCYKGEFCEDNHTRPARGAVTADLEPVLAWTAEKTDVEPSAASVLVKILNVISPDSFYVTFPHGMRDVLTITEAARRKEWKAEFSDMSEELQNVASKFTRKSIPDSKIAGGTLVAVKTRDKNWCRAKVRSTVELSDAQAEVFLVDYGVTESVLLKNVRLLDPRFAVIPFQAEEAKLSLLQPPSSGGWRVEARQKLKEIVESGDYLTAVVEMVNPGGTMSLRLSVVKDEQDEDVRDKLCEAGVAERLGKGEGVGNQSIYYYPG